MNLKMRFNRLFLAALSWGVTMSHAASPASTPFTPNWQQRHQLQLLVDHAGLALPMTHWPLPAAVVEDALMRLPNSAPPRGTIDAHPIRQKLLSDLTQHLQGQSRVQIRQEAEAPAGFDDNYTPGSSLHLIGPETKGWIRENISYAHRLGVKLEQSSNSLSRGTSTWGTDGQHQARLDGSAAVIGLGEWNVQAFSQKFWWGPGWQNSLILSHNAPAWNGMGVQRNSVAASSSPWWRWAGPWNFEWFVAQAQDPWVTASQPRGFLMSGFRLTLQPQPWLEVGLSRAMQVAGAGRPNGVKNFLDATLGQRVNQEIGDAPDSSGQIAGIDARLRCPNAALNCAFYTQWMGEDAAGKLPLPYKFMSLWGLELTDPSGRYRFFGEYNNTHANSLPWENPRFPGYTNGVYTQGYTHGTRWIGSSFGGGSEVTTLGWLDSQNERMIKLHWGSITHSAGAYAPNLSAPRGALKGLSMRQTWHWQGYRISPEMSVLNLSQGQDQWANKRQNLRLGIEVSRRY